jgi:competence protein ComEC
MTPALACLLAWSIGVGGATVALPGSAPAGAVALVGAALAACGAAVVRPAVVCLAATAFLLGVVRSEVPHGDPTAAARAPALAGQVVLLDGQVADDPRLLAGGAELLVEPKTLTTPGGPRAPAGAVIVFVRGSTDVGIDDRVQVGGRLDLPRDRPDFDRRAYAAQKGAYLEIRSARVQVTGHTGGPRALPGWLRDRYRQAIAQLVPPPHSEVLVGLVLGIRTGIPPDLQRDLIATGLVHLLVLSGLKVAVFARLVVGLLRPMVGRGATLPAVALIALYALVGGATPAAVRAAAMGCLTLVAAHLGRPTHLWTSLGAAGAAMLAWRPELAWDVGFQLSFAGTAAIVLLTPGIDGWLTRPAGLRRLPSWLREPFAVTCAAQLGTVPLMATDFHLLSPVAPIANAAVLPLLPAMVAAGLLLAPLAAVPEVGRLAALPLTGALAYLEQVAALLARVPAAAVPVPALSPGAGAAYYAALTGAVAAARSRGAARAAAIAAAVLVPLVVGGAELVAWSRPAPGAAVLAVGVGQAILLTGPGGAVLVDGGPSPARLADELGGRLPPWSRRLAALVITGPGLGHVGGLAGLGYPADLVVVPAGQPAGTAWRTAALGQAARGARVAVASAGERLDVAGLRLEVLSPEPRPPEPEQLSLRVVGPNGASFCDLADLDPDAQAAAASHLTGACDALLLPNGGRSSPAPELLAAARPRRLVASDAGGQLARDLPRGATSRTSQEGTIVLPL